MEQIICNKCEKNLNDIHPRQIFKCDYCNKYFCFIFDTECLEENYFEIFYFDEITDDEKMKVSCEKCFLNR